MAELLQGSANDAKLLADERFLRRVAFSYHEEGHSQEAIAKAESCSRQVVGKALQKARERGIVRITIVPDMRTGYLRNLAREVRVELGLQDLILVPGQNMNTIDVNKALDDVVMEIASATADYLEQLLENEDVLAVSGGKKFMRSLVGHTKPNKSLSKMRVVPTIGFVDAQTNFGDANLIAHDLAQAYGAVHYWFACPAFLSDDEQVRRTRQIPMIKEVYKLMEQANVVVTSVWSPQTNVEMKEQGILKPEQFAQIEALQPVADINHWLFDTAGRCINEILKPPPYFLSGLEIPRLKDRIRQNNAKVILVAGGSPAYVPAVRAVLRAGLANILVTDHVTAQLLLLKT